MTAPMDPDNLDDGPTEFSWGPGLFPPGIANNEGQRYAQDDFGEKLNMVGNSDNDDIYARAVADRRTDSTDPDSGRDFTVEGNPDRYGAQPPLVRADTQPNRPTVEIHTDRKPLERKW